MPDNLAEKKAAQLRRAFHSKLGLVWIFDPYTQTYWNRYGRVSVQEAAIHGSPQQALQEQKRK